MRDLKIFNMATISQKVFTVYTLLSRSLSQRFATVRTPAPPGINLVRYYASKKGLKKKKLHSSAFDADVAEGVVDIGKLSTNMETEVDKLRQEFRNNITTRISPAMFDNIKVPSGKRKVPLGNIASIMNKDDKYVLDLTSSPSLTSSAMKALNENSIFSPLLEGNTITVSVPRLTMEVRESLLRSAKVICEEARIGIRKARQKGMSDVKKQKKVMSQDDARMVEGYIQLLTDNYVKQVDELLVEKSKELLQR